MSTKRIFAALATVIVGVGLAGCSIPSGSNVPDEPVAFSVGGVEITVGETPVGKLYDAGFELRAGGAVGGVGHAILLEPDSYYDMISLHKAEQGYGLIDLVTGTEAVELKDGLVAQVHSTVDEDLDASNLMVEGICLADLTVEKALEVVEGSQYNQQENRVERTTENYTFALTFADGKAVELTVACLYEIDYNS